MHESYKFEKGFPKQEISRTRDEIVLRAIEMPAIQKAVSSNPDKLNAIRDVREMLPEYCPEIASLPQEALGSDADNRAEPRLKNPPGTTKPANDFLIAKAIVDSLREKKK
jgi:hypothetical protein